MACMLQSWNQLEDRRSKNNKVSKGMWEAIETKAEKVRLAEAKGGRRKRKKEKETRRQEIEKGEEGKEKT